MPKRINLADRRFGELTVIRLSNKRKDGKQLWECKCSCGNTTYVHGYSLLHDHYKSCGCKQAIKRDEGLKRYLAKDAVGGTRKSALKAKLHKGNKSGHKGVRWLKNRKKWNAYIGFKGKSINLGYFKNKEDAIKARKQAEEKYHKPYLEGINNEQE